MGKARSLNLDNFWYLLLHPSTLEAKSNILKRYVTSNGAGLICLSGDMAEFCCFNYTDSFCQFLYIYIYD